MTETPSNIYKSEITQPVSTSYLSVLQPQNSKQVENIRLKKLQKQRISHDALSMCMSLLMTNLSLITPCILTLT